MIDNSQNTSHPVSNRIEDDVVNGPAGIPLDAPAGNAPSQDAAEGSMPDDTAPEEVHGSVEAEYESGGVDITGGSGDDDETAQGAAADSATGLEHHEDSDYAELPSLAAEDAGNDKHAVAAQADDARSDEQAADLQPDESAGERKPAVARAARKTSDEPLEEIKAVDEEPKKDWYILKVQSNREDSIRDGLQRRVAIAGLDKFFGEIIVPTEMVSEFKGGKKRVVKRKLYPGYIVVHMEINDDTWFLVRETPGIGDFTGSAGKPTPMLPHEVQRIVAKQEEKTDEAPRLKISFNVGDRVKINEGTFENFEGEVDGIDEASGRVTVMINIFGRSTPVELEYWQIEVI